MGVRYHLGRVRNEVLVSWQLQEENAVEIDCYLWLRLCMLVCTLAYLNARGSRELVLD